MAISVRKCCWICKHYGSCVDASDDPFYAKRMVCDYFKLDPLLEEGD